MRKVLMAAAIVAVTSVPMVASADDAMATGRPTTTGPAAMATMVCRPAAAGETPTAMMMASQKPIVCKPVAMMMKDGKLMNGPNLSRTLTPEQMEAAWDAWIMSMFAVGGGGG
jgi:hypothetical protein